MSAVLTAATTTGSTLTWVIIDNDPRVGYLRYAPEYNALPEPFKSEFFRVVEAYDTPCRTCFGNNLVGWVEGNWNPTVLLRPNGGVPAAICEDCADRILNAPHVGPAAA